MVSKSKGIRMKWPSASLVISLIYLTSPIHRRPLVQSNKAMYWFRYLASVAVWPSLYYLPSCARQRPSYILGLFNVCLDSYVSLMFKGTQMILQSSQECYAQWINVRLPLLIPECRLNLVISQDEALVISSWYSFGFEACLKFIIQCVSRYKELITQFFFFLRILRVITLLLYLSSNVILSYTLLLSPLEPGPHNF